MANLLDSLPVLDTTGLGTVFQDAADFARTDGRLKPGVRRHAASADRQEFVNARKQSAADKVLHRLPDPGEALHLVMAGDFDLANLIPRIVNLAQEPAEALDLATLGFNDATIDILTRLSDAGTVRAIRLLASHYFKSVDTSLWSRAHHELTSRGHTLFIARNHAKLQLYKFRSGRTITLMSSANLRSCRNAEFAVLFGDAATLGFWQGVIDELIEESRRWETASQTS